MENGIHLVLIYIIKYTIRADGDDIFFDYLTYFTNMQKKFRFFYINFEKTIDKFLFVL